MTPIILLASQVFGPTDGPKASSEKCTQVFNIKPCFFQLTLAATFITETQRDQNFYEAIFNIHKCNSGNLRGIFSKTYEKQ